MRAMPKRERRLSITTPRSLKTQKPAERPRRAWCRPPIAWKLRTACPDMIRSSPSSAVPATADAISKQPGNAGVSP